MIKRTQEPFSAWSERTANVRCVNTRSRRGIRWTPETELFIYTAPEIRSDLARKVLLCVEESMVIQDRKFDSRVYKTDYPTDYRCPGGKV